MQIARGIRAGDETSTVKEEELRPASAMEEGRIFPLRRFSRTADMLRDIDSHVGIDDVPKAHDGCFLDAQRGGRMEWWRTQSDASRSLCQFC